MRKVISALLLLTALSMSAQYNEIYHPNIASLQVMAGNAWTEMPVTTLDGDYIKIEFDELSHNYQRYTYRIEHCEADWTKSSSLFPSDYIEGFYEDNVIDDTQQSIDTYQLYTHYRLTIPNDKCRLTRSGNYKLTVLDNNNNNEPMLTACFMITEQKAGINMEYTSRTDFDINGRHQQINMEVTYGAINVTAPDSQLTVYVLQNQDWNTQVVNPKAQYRMHDGLKWEHCRELIFRGGTEYHKFETLDPSHTTMGLASVGWDGETSEWHAYVEPDYPAANYVYDVSANGSFLIRNSDYYESSVRCDYVQTHFELHAPMQNGKVYLAGVWTNNKAEPKYEMEWNYETNTYKTVVPLKQGYYSYRYIVMHSDGTFHPLSNEGSFFETGNDYQALLYFRGSGDRTDRLVAYKTISTRE